MTTLLDPVARRRLDPGRFRAVLREHAAGVAVITTMAQGPVGFCATSLSSVSLQPPMVSFAVATGSASGRAWRHASLGIVHLLTEGQQHLVEAFGRPGGRKFGDVPWRWTTDGLPLLEEAATWMLVQPHARMVAGDHELLVCHVLDGEVAPARAPLVQHRGSVSVLPGPDPSLEATGPG